MCYVYANIVGFQIKRNIIIYSSFVHLHPRNTSAYMRSSLHMSLLPSTSKNVRYSDSFMYHFQPNWLLLK